MRVKRDQGLSLGWFVTRLQPPELAGVFLVKATFSLSSEGAELLAEGAEVCGDQEDEDGKGGLVYASDFVPFKPRADVLVKATAHAPEGTTVRHLQVSMRVGDLCKRLLVVGDRKWKRGLLGRAPTEPEGFTAMPLSWGRALGGPGDRANPAGTGRESEVLPNVELRDRHLQSSRDALPPAGFGPIAVTWEPRASKVGTYGGDYLQKRWPFYPADMEWGYFNSAPADQQVEGYLRGDEELEFENLRPDAPRLVSRLPSRRARCLVTLAGGEFREVMLRLDTLSIDLDAGQAVLVWRGFTPVASLKLKEVEHILAVLDPLDGARSLDELMALRVEGEEVDPEEAAADQEFAASMAAIEAASAAAGGGAAGGDDDAAENPAAAESEQYFEELERHAASLQGVDVETLRLPDPTPEPSVAADFAALTERTRRLEPAVDFGPEEVAAPELEPAEEGEPEEAPPHTRESVMAAVAAKTSLSGADLAGLDLSGLDLSGADLRGAVFESADLSGSRFGNADLTGALLAEAKCDGADFTGTVLDAADFAGASLQGARFASASLAETVLEGLVLAGLDFSGSRGEGAYFGGSDLSGAIFRGADLPKVDFSDSILEGADLSRCHMRRGQFEGAKAKGIVLAGAQVPGLHATEADLREADLKECAAEGGVFEDAILDGADLKYARLQNSILTQASLQKADLSRADLARSVLDDANFEGARLLQTNLLHCSMERVRLDGADLRWANLYGCGLWEARVEGADLREANVRGTRLGKS